MQSYGLFLFLSSSSWLDVVTDFQVIYPRYYSVTTQRRQLRRDRNRKRSKRRSIYCPIHGCYLDSVSPKYPLYTTKPEHLQQRGMGRRVALTVIAGFGTVPLTGEWLEAFWCDHCQETQWYHVRKTEANRYELVTAPVDLWQQASGVILPSGNPTVGEFTRRQARQTRFNGIKDFSRIG